MVVVTGSTAYVNVPDGIFSSGSHTHPALEPFPRMIVYTWDGILFVSTGTSRIYNQLGSAYNIEQVFLSIGQPPTDAAVIVDVNNNGTSIFSSRPTIPAGSFTGSSVSFTSSPYTWNMGDWFTVDIDQIGSGTAGTNLVTHIVVRTV